MGDGVVGSNVPHGQPDLVDRRFNHDLLIEVDDQTTAKWRWPEIAHLLIESELVERFSIHERSAKRQKRVLQNLGSVAVILMLGALLGAAGYLWVDAHGGGHRFRLATELSAIFGLLLALLASRHGPLRRRWLKNRFLTEVFRQWHFRRLLNGCGIEQGIASKDLQLQARDRDFSALLQDLAGNVGQKMDELAESSRDPLGTIPTPMLPKDTQLRAQLIDAYRTLRLDHQREFAVYKLSADDRTFWGMSIRALVLVTDQLAGATLVLALAVSIVQLFVQIAWAPFVAISLGITGVAVRSWRDGLALNTEQERYQEMLHRLDLLTARWENAEGDTQRFVLAEELEQTALEELRSFIRAHEAAQFLL